MPGQRRTCFRSHRRPLLPQRLAGLHRARPAAPSGSGRALRAGSDYLGEPVNAPNGGFTSVSLGGAELSALGNKVTRHRQTLRFGNALFERQTSFAFKGTTLTVRSARFLSAETPNLGVIRFSITCSRAATVTVRTGIDGNIWDLNGPHLLGLAATRRDSVLFVEEIGRASCRGKGGIAGVAG